LADFLKRDVSFRADLIAKADAVFDLLIAEARAIIDANKAVEKLWYPMAVEEPHEDHAVVLLGRLAIHVTAPPFAAMRRDGLYTAEGDLRDEARRLMAVPAHAVAASQCVAIEFTRASAEGYRLKRPGKALVFGALYVYAAGCKLSSPTAGAAGMEPFGNLSHATAQQWAPMVMREMLFAAVGTGLATWPEVPRSQPYELVLLDAFREVQQEKSKSAIGFARPDDVMADDNVPGPANGTGDGSQ
jgi:hypothetical protein